MLRIWLFGSLCVANDSTGEQVTAVSGRSGSLLAYLALGRGRYFSRTELLGTLWPERMASMTAGSFNTALWRLRRLVECPPFQHGELIASDRRGAIRLNGSREVWLDIEEFERRIASGLSRPIEQLGDAEIEDLRTGVALYKSDILMEFTDRKLGAARAREASSPLSECAVAIDAAMRSAANTARASATRSRSSTATRCARTCIGS